MSGSSSSWSAGVLGRRLAAVRRACARVKTRRSDPGGAAARRQPATLAPLDELVPGGASTAWSCVCLSILLPAAALTVAGVTSAYVTGPAAILSVLLAAAAVSLAGIWSRHTHTHTHTQPSSGLFSRTAWISRYQKGKTSPDLNEARDDRVWGWQ